MHISKTPDGTWRAIVQHKGNRRSVIAPTKGAVEFAAAQLLLEMGGLPRPTDLTIGSIVAGYVADKTATWSPTTLADRTAAVKLIPKKFLERNAAGITVPVVLALWRQMAAAKVTPHRVHRAGSVLGAATAAAIRAGTIPGPNAFHLSPAPAPPPSSVSVPSIEDVRALLAAKPATAEEDEPAAALLDKAASVDPLFSLFVRVAATTGARRGEICAMAWSDVDLERGTWSIRRRVVKLPGEPPVELAGTKTGVKGQRTITLDPKTIGLLTVWKAGQPAPADCLLPDPVWVFSNDHGQNPMSPNAMTNRFDHLRARVGAHGVRLHDLRHYVATSMLEDGESPHDVANQIGHASTATTLNVYGHFVPGRNRKAIDRLASRLD